MTTLRLTGVSSPDGLQVGCASSFQPEESYGAKSTTSSCVAPKKLRASATRSSVLQRPVWRTTQGLEQQWRRLFDDPGQWWDNRRNKKSRKEPDFIHAATELGLRIDNRFKPGWVEAKLEGLQGARAGPCRAQWASGCVENGVASSGDPTSVERLWHKYFEDPSQWWDNRNDKLHPKSPDFGHKQTKEALWVNSSSTPEWVKELLERQTSSRRAETGISNSTSAGSSRTTNAADLNSAREDSFAWTGRISQHIKCGQCSQALRVYEEMREAGVKISSYSVNAALKACSSLQDLNSCRKIHGHVVEGGLESNVFVGNMLVDVYSKCGSLIDARRVFEKMPNRTVVSWNTMISGYAQMQEGAEALQLYTRMQQEGIIPNDRTFVAVLKGCSSLVTSKDGKECDLMLVKRQSLAQTRAIHKDVQMGEFETDVFVGTMLVDAYAKCGSLVDARQVFEKIPNRSVVSWNAMILGYAQMEKGEEALQLYARMQKEGLVPNDRTFVNVLKGCSSLAALEEGEKAAGVVLKTQCLEQVRAIHSDLMKGKFESDLFVGNMLLDAYAKCGSLVDARNVFEKMPHRNVVSWTAMILGYAQMEEGEQALHLYAQMQEEGVVPNDCTFLGGLKACAIVGALQQGKEIHAQIQEQGLEADVDIGSSLVNLYAKCGSLVDARRVFDGLATKNAVTWNALLYGYAKNGNGQVAMQCFTEMREQGFEPDEATFTSLLVACCHGALVNEGQQYFKMMVEDYGIAPSVYHYSCMVDLLGRSGRLDEAENLLQSMPFENDVVGWISLLTACRSHKDMERGERCFDRLIALEPENAVAYVLLGNIYANAGRWEDAEKVESLRKSAGARKKAARACIEVKRKVHEFTVGEERSDISSKVRSMSKKLKEGGHVPQTQLVLKAVSEQDKEDALCGHAEKLALAFGLLNTPDGTTLLVTKNLRMCNDCHSSTKIMSRVEKREIVVRDAHRVHRFAEGACSCGDRH